MLGNYSLAEAIKTGQIIQELDGSININLFIDCEVGSMEERSIQLNGNFTGAGVNVCSDGSSNVVSYNAVTESNSELAKVTSELLACVKEEKDEDTYKMIKQMIEDVNNENAKKEKDKSKIKGAVNILTGVIGGIAKVASIFAKWKSLIGE